MWEKKGLIHTCDIYGTGYAQDAFIDILNSDVWRIYFSLITIGAETAIGSYIDLSIIGPSDTFLYISLLITSTHPILNEYETKIIV